MKGLLRSLALLALVAFLAAPRTVDAAGVATAAIDFGDEWMKISLVKAGVPMEIVLNTESKRKTNTAVSLRGNKWSFSEDAIADCIKYPENGYRYLLPLLGQLANSTVVSDYLKAFPHAKIEAHPTRGTVVFRQSEDKAYTVEELVGMILRHAVTLAEKTAEQPVTGVVVTVPPFFSQAQRKAMLLAGKFARINIMQLLNTNTAVALHYGVFRRSEFNETEQNILFYDMGATSTVATIVGFKTEAEKAGSKTRHPQLTVKSVGYDATLGGLDFDLRLRDHLNKQFLEKYKGKYKNDITTNARAQGKLLKEANRVKYILSVNTDTYAQVEGLFEEIDFKVQVTREQFETLCADLFSRTVKPIEDALRGADMKLEDISQFIIVGGGVRVPKIQQQLTEFLKGKEIGKGINGDEAASLGSAYQAAVLSKSFKVLKFVVKDATLFPIEVHYTKGKDEEDAAGEPQLVSRVIFDRFNTMPQKKLLPLRRVNSDVSFSLNYGNMPFLDQRSFNMLGALNISTVSLAGIGAAFEANTAADTKGVKVHFRLDESGIVQVLGAEAVFETLPPQAEAETVEEGKEDAAKDDAAKEEDAATAETGSEGAAEKKAAGEEAAESSATKEEEKKEEKKEEEKKEEKKEEEAAKGEEKKEEAAKEEEKKESSEEGKKDGAEGTTAQASEEAVNGTSSANNGTKAETVPKKAPKPEKKVVKVNLAVTQAAKDFADANNEELDKSITIIADLERVEKEKQARDEAQNVLETLIYKIKDLVETKKFASAAKAEELTKLSEDASSSQLWLEDNSGSATAAEFTAKVRQLNETMERVNFRIRDALSRPEAIKKFMNVLNMSISFMEKIRSTNDTEGEVWIKEDELKELERLSTEGKEWIEEKKTAQAALQANDDPVLTTSAIEMKITRLERELSFLLKRPKPRPKPKFKADKNSTATNGTDDATASNKEKTINVNEEDSDAQAEKKPEAETASEGGKEESSKEKPKAEKKKETKAEKKAAADKKEKEEIRREKEEAKKEAKKAAKKDAKDARDAKEAAAKAEKAKAEKAKAKAEAAAEEEEEADDTTTEAPKTSSEKKRSRKARREENAEPSIKLELPGKEDL